jgi:hypothetical protein
LERKLKVIFGLSSHNLEDELVSRTEEEPGDLAANFISLGRMEFFGKKPKLLLPCFI